jgi:hypothetical protein
MTSTVCEVKGFLSSCGAAAAAQCVYCARPFCDRHGEVLEDGQEVCSRKFCVAKKDDLVKHFAYKEAVLVRNRQRLCGVEVCKSNFVGQCSRCKGYFCEKHAFPSDEPAVETQSGAPQAVRQCKHCEKRRPIWTRI